MVGSCRCRRKVARKWFRNNINLVLANIVAIYGADPKISRVPGALGLSFLAHKVLVIFQKRIRKTYRNRDFDPLKITVVSMKIMDR